MPSIFSRIIQGEIPAYKVAETDDFIAILDAFPIAKGHTLVIPKQETDYIFDLSDELYVGLHVFAREVAHALRLAVPCKRIGVAVIGLEVPHAHIHLVPMHKVDDMRFDKPKLSFTPDEMRATLADIHRHLPV